MKLSAFVLVAFLTLLGCGNKATQIGENPPGNQPVPSKLQVAVFGAPWCGPCKKTIPAVQTELNTLEETQRKAVSLVLYVITGKKSTEPPDQKTADEYLSLLKLQGTALPDPQARKYREMLNVEEDGIAIPAGAILDKDGKVLERYQAGFLSPQEVGKKVRELLK